MDIIILIAIVVALFLVIRGGIINQIKENKRSDNFNKEYLILKDKVFSCLTREQLNDICLNDYARVDELANCNLDYSRMSYITGYLTGILQILNEQDNERRKIKDTERGVSGVEESTV